MTPLQPPVSPQQLTQALSRVQRVPLAFLPTPLQYCPRLSQAIGGPSIYVKRDDLTGLAFGGNKTRQLEYLLADVIASKADTVVAGAYTQSNWCRQIAAAANQLGLHAVLVLASGEKGSFRQGNLLLDQLLGADVTIVELQDIQRLPPLLEQKAAELKRDGRKPYVINPFGLATLARSSVGYVKAALELDVQLQSMNVCASHVYVSGANMTPAGLSVGMRALGRATHVVGIAPIRWNEDRATDIARIANATCELLGLEMEFLPSDIHNDESFVGQRYGVVSDEARDAFSLAARSEGLILDPVYTSKALAGLRGHVAQGRLNADHCVVFVHTGGQPAVFAYGDELLGVTDAVRSAL